MPDIFKNSDVRGRYPEDLDEDKAFKLSLAFGKLCGGTVVLGGDTRASTPSLMEACRKGLRGAGCRVLDAGIVTTPMLNFAKVHSKAAGSLMVTASHNPADQNGLKPGLADYPLPAESMRRWKQRASENSPPGGLGGALERVDILDPYTESLRNHFGGGTLRVVLDPGGGAATGPAPEIFRRLGYKVEVVNGEPGLEKADRPPDPVLPGVLGGLIAAIKKSKARVGLAFDGDGDRMAAVDENGEALSTDGAFSLFARRILRDKPGGVVIFDVKMTQAVEDVVRECGGKSQRCPTGQLNVMTWLRAKNAVLAGEYSGHYVFPAYAPYDDAMAAALLLCRIIEVEGKGSLARMALGLRTRYRATPEMRIAVEGNLDDVVQGIRRGLAEGASLETMDGVRASYPEGWGLARASGTESAISFRFESTSGEADLEPLVAKFMAGAPAALREKVLGLVHNGQPS